MASRGGIRDRVIADGPEVRGAWKLGKLGVGWTRSLIPLGSGFWTRGSPEGVRDTPGPG